MSYWVYLCVDTGGNEPVDFWERNYTSNVAVMWCEAGADLAEMNGMPAREADGILTGALIEMRRRPSIYQAMNPANGWGTYDGCIEFLTAIRDACREHPTAQLRVSH